MKVIDIVVPASKIVRVASLIHKRRTKKEEPTKDKVGSFNDYFGGMTDYPTTGVAGTVNPDTNP